MKHRRASRLLLSTACLALLAGSLGAQDTPPGTLSPQAATRLVSTYGLAALRSIGESEGPGVAPSGLPPEDQSLAIERMIRDVVEVQDQYASATALVRTTEAGVELISGGLAAVTGGVGAIIVGSAAGYGLEQGRQAIAAQAADDVEALLAVHGEVILTELGLTPRSLQEALQAPGGPEAMRDRLLDSQTLFRDLGTRARGNEAVREAQMEMIVAGLQNFDIAAAATIRAQGVRIEGAEARLTELAAFQVETTERFAQVEADIERLDGAVVALKESVNILDGRVDQLEASQAVVTDFMFGQMPAEAKARLLRTGYLLDSIRCPEDDPECDPVQIHADLITAYEDRAEVEGLISDIQGVTSVIRDVDTIARNLGVELPEEVGMAYGLANVAVSVLGSWPNPLGVAAGLSGLSGIFGGGGGSAEARRHAEMMAFLDKRFDAIDQQLLNIIENQQRTLDAIISVSEQIDAGFRSIEGRLISITFTQELISDGVRQLIWAPWERCLDVYTTAESANLIDRTSFDFRAEDDIRQVVSRAGDNAVECINTMRGSFAAQTEPQTFIQFGDLSSVDEWTTPLPAEVSEADQRSPLHHFRDDIFQPAYTRLAIFAETHLEGRVADAFALLARPTPTTDDWRDGLIYARNTPLTCEAPLPDADPHREARHCDLLASSGVLDRQVMEDRVRAQLSRARIPDLVLKLTDWVHVAAQIADRRVGNTWVYADEELDAALQGGDVSQRFSGGRDLVEGAIRALDIAIATSAMTYGPLPAHQALDEFNSYEANNPRIPRDTLIADLRANPYLAYNLAQFILEDYHMAAHGTLRAPQETYQTAYEAALLEDNPSVRFRLLDALFIGNRSASFAFAVTNTGEPGLVIYADPANVVDAARDQVIPLPPPAAYAEGRIAMPTSHTELLAARMGLVDRLLGYAILDNLDESQAVAAVSILLAGSSTGE